MWLLVDILSLAIREKKRHEWRIVSAYSSISYPTWPFFTNFILMWSFNWMIIWKNLFCIWNVSLYLSLNYRTGHFLFNNFTKIIKSYKWLIFSQYIYTTPIKNISPSLLYIYIYIYIYMYFGSISSLKQISINIIDIFCLHIFFLILLYCPIDFIVFGRNWLICFP